MGNSRFTNSTSSLVRSTHCPFPSYPMRRVFSTAGNPIFLTAASTSPAPFTSANEVVAIPNFLKRVFSFSRSCAASSASGGGYTGTCFAKKRAASTVTFSNSYVTSSNPCANFSSAS